MALRGTSVRDALDSAVIPLKAAGCESPRLDAELLLAAAMETDRVALTMDPDHPLDSLAVSVFRDFVFRRREREPVAYILGSKGFRRIELQVDRRVLVPRPETEELVEAALTLPEGARVLDVGTGSGAVALSLACERPDLDVTGADADSEALEVARDNGARLGLAVQWLQSDLLADAPGPWDAVVSNPPYVARAEIDELEPEVARHEPRSALDGGRDGLAIVRALVEQVAAQQVQWLGLEIGAGQASAVRALVHQAGFGGFEIRPDLAGIERVVVARR